MADQPERTPRGDRPTGRTPRIRGAGAELEPREAPRPEPEIERKELITSARTGDRYVRITREKGGIRRLGAGHLEATREVLRPHSGLGRAFSQLKEIVLGPALASAELAHERLSKVKALAVFSSDALSSSAYATEEILRVLVLAGAAALSLTLPIAFAIGVLLVIVATSYRQTIKAYPQGGGSYIVTKDNLGTWPALVAAAALLIDYVLTVSVSVSAGVAAITSAVPLLHEHAVGLAVGFIVLITLVNLRGVSESGTIFAAPTYLFILMAFAMLALGTVRFIEGGPVNVDAASATLPVLEPLSIVLVLRAFASGNAALTGVEAISDGVPAFKPPEWKNARTTLTWMGVILGALFLGISFLSVQFGVLPNETETVVSQLGRIAFGGDTPPYYVYQAATMLILVLAANTAFSDFPRLGYFLARDHFIPHQFQFRGDRLAFSTGILALGLLSAAVLTAFHAETHALIPLYAVGVFVSFTLSQSGMVLRWWRKREPGWRAGLPINALGAATTGLVAVIIAATKFEHGAWMVIVLIPTLVLLMRGVNAHYTTVADELALPRPDEPLPELPEPTVLVPVPGLNRAVEHTLAVARALSPNVIALHVTDDSEAGSKVREQWDAWGTDIPLVILESPYRSLMAPLLAYVDRLQRNAPRTPIVVVLSEFVPRHFWEYFLHNQSALRLKASLFFRPNTVVMDVPYHLEH
jgi:amino acid transporter